MADAGGAHVDWQLVEDELRRVGRGEFDSVSFDSLPHVLSLLNESDLEVRLEQLKRQQGKIESHVNAVIREYHNGFNGALQNFSRILSHFTDAQTRIEGLRNALEDSRKRLGSRTHHIHAQWRKSITLSTTVQLMDDISGIMLLPERICELETAKEWTEAVQVLIEGCRALAREELRDIGGLANLRKEMARRRLSLQQLILEELQAGVYAQQSRDDGQSLDLSEDREFYNDSEAAAGKVAERRLSTLNAKAVPLRNTSAAVLRPGSSFRLNTAEAGKLGKNRSSAIGAGSGQDFDLLGPAAGQSASNAPGALRRRNSGLNLQNTDSMDTVDQQRLAARRISKDLGDIKMGRKRSSMDLSRGRSTMDAGMSARGSAFFADAGRGFEPLVNCLVALGGASDAKAALRESVPSRIRDIIRQVLQRAAKSAIDRTHGSNLTAATLSKEEITPTVPSMTERRARNAVQAVLDNCESAFRNLISLQHMIIIEGSAAEVDSSVEFIKQQLSDLPVPVSPESQAIDAASSVRSFMKFSIIAGDDNREKSSALDVVHEAELTWAVLMKECEALLKDILNPQGMDVREASSIEQSAPAGVGNVSGAGLLTFSFDVMLEGLELANMQPVAGMGSVGQPQQQSKAIGDLVEVLQTPPSYRPDIVAALGHEPSTYFASTLYRPVVQFVDMGNRSVDGMVREVAGARTQNKQEASRLRHFFEGIVNDSFLPRVRVDIRARCNAVLENEEMFRPRARFKASYEKEIAKGRPVLGAALAVEQLMGEVMGWAANMPLYSPKLNEVAEGLLARLVDACTAVYVTLVRSCQSASAALACRTDISTKMAAEASAIELLDAVKFYVPKKEDEFDSRPAVAAIEANGLGSSGEAGEIEVLQLLLKEPPVQKGNLLVDEIGDISRVEQLAALSDTLEYIAEVVEAKGAAGGAWMQQKDTGVVAKTSSHHRGIRGSGNHQLPDGLATLVSRCLSLSGRCLRTLRLELMLLIRHSLQELVQDNWLNDDSESIQAGERLGVLTRSATRLEDAISPFLPKRYRRYVFGPAPFTAARTLRALLSEMPEITPLGIDRITKICGILRPALSALGSKAASKKDNDEFQQTCIYYGLLTERVDSLIKFAREKSGRYSPSEYLALLEVHVPGRNVTDEHRVLLAKALGREKVRTKVSRSAISRHSPK